LLNCLEIWAKEDSSDIHIGDEDTLPSSILVVVHSWVKTAGRLEIELLEILLEMVIPGVRCLDESKERFVELQDKSIALFCSLVNIMGAQHIPLLSGPPEQRSLRN
jgi:hypothetical protein